MPRPAPMLPVLATALALSLLLAGCGRSGKADGAASAENVEMPAEEAMRGLDADATPTPDAEATAEAADGAGSAVPAPTSPAAAKPTVKPEPSASPIRM